MLNACFFILLSVKRLMKIVQMKTQLAYYSVKISNNKTYSQEQQLLKNLQQNALLVSMQQEQYSWLGFPAGAMGDEQMKTQRKARITNNNLILSCMRVKHYEQIWEVFIDTNNDIQSCVMQFGITQQLNSHITCRMRSETN